MHCDPTSRNASNNAALHLAAQKGHLGVVKFFISDLNCDPNFPGRYGQTPLHYAAWFGYLHIVKYLTDEQHCNPSCLDKDGYTPLHCAAIEGHMDIVKFLTVEKDCDPLSKNNDNTTILHCADVGGHLDIPVVKFLIEGLKCPPDIAGPLDSTPLQSAILMDRFDIAQYLQKHSVIPHIYTAIAMMKQLGLLK